MILHDVLASRQEIFRAARQNSPQDQQNTANKVFAPRPKDASDYNGNRLAERKSAASRTESTHGKRNQHHREAPQQASHY